jgi:hypothetical protein
MRRGGAKRQVIQLVLAQVAPADESKAAAGTQRTEKITKGLGRIVKEHDAKAGEDGVEGSRGKAVCLGIAADEGDIFRVPIISPQNIDRIRENVQSDDLSTGPYPSGKSQRRAANATAHIENPMAL